MSRCKICRADYVKRSISHKACSPDCALIFAAQERVNAENKAHKLKLIDIKPLSYWKAKTQQAVNAYVRARDGNEPCISCGRHHTGQYHAGHYLTTAAHPELRYNPDNIHKQCSACNNHKSGNISEYRPRILAKIGQDRLDWIEGPHPPAKYTRQDLQAIEADFKARLKSMR